MDQALNAHIGVAPAEPDAEIEKVFDPGGVLFLDAAVIGRDDARVDPDLPERLRQRARHIGKAAGLGKGRAFRRRQQYLRHPAQAMLTEQGGKTVIYHIRPP